MKSWRCWKRWIPAKPIRHSLRDDIPGAARAIRWYAEALDKVYGEVAPPAATSWR